ncbi:sensor histidine kinase [Streptomyces sp. NRRL S-87]|uniref:sensor histidine kinase n=1 Tax=Streptomyces sp. NRRL S-87 TaxID=1463920 RepID=UPI0004BEB761|nr:histidine kinase [Streptomyces sp. NRRL S-87]
MRLPRPHRHDVLIAVVGLLSGLLLYALGLHENAGRHLVPDRVALLPLALSAGLELLRRTVPRAALVAGTVAVVANELTVGSLATVVMFTDLMYAAVVYGTPRSARQLPFTTGGATVAVTVAALAWWRDAEALMLGVLTAIVCFLPAITGAAVRNHREAAEAARLRAEQTSRLAELDRKQAVSAERARMARELHDMVANHLSAIAIHSTAALSIDSAATSREALAVIRENSVQGLAEMRRLIGLLRATSGDGGPVAVPRLEGLGDLLEQARKTGAGSGLEFALADARPAGREALPAPVELAAYRIVQESLTNAVKHAVPGTVEVRLELADGRLTVRVDSPYGERGTGPRAPGSGAGLVGMRERVALLDGEFEAGPAGPVWRVRAVLPADEKAGKA